MSTTTYCERHVNAEFTLVTHGELKCGQKYSEQHGPNLLLAATSAMCSARDQFLSALKQKPLIRHDEGNRPCVILELDYFELPDGRDLTSLSLQIVSTGFLDPDKSDCEVLDEMMSQAFKRFAAAADRLGLTREES